MSTLEKKLEKFIKETVENESHIYNMTLALSSVNKSFEWSGAAGIAIKSDNLKIIHETPFFIASITKLYTAVLIMKLFEEKKLKLDDKITNYLPESLVKGIHVFKGVDHTDSITIKHLLSHTSGIADYFMEKPKNGINFFDTILKYPDKLYSIDDTITIARENLTPNFEPGKKAKYSDTNYQLLGRIIEGITDKELHDAYYDYLFLPLGLKNTWLYRRSEPIEKSLHPVAEFYYNDQVISYNKPFETAWADGGLISTTRDLLTFLQALFAGKIINNQTTLPLMHVWKGIGFPLQYGFGTMKIELPRFMTFFRKLPPLIGHLGASGTFLLYAKAFDLYIAGAINQANSPSKTVRLVFNLLNMVRKDFLN
ncbi:MAG: serine hydrolase domain-containing protein [Candidatus Hodarchaeales archaeon]|jgi:CubicO group peptidase (beta-lactamase class C family)